MAVSRFHRVCMLTYTTHFYCIDHPCNAKLHLCLFCALIDKQLRLMNWTRPGSHQEPYKSLANLCGAINALSVQSQNTLPYQALSSQQFTTLYSSPHLPVLQKLWPKSYLLQIQHLVLTFSQQHQAFIILCSNTPVMS